ncbi:hypothetical protein CHS0354_004973 [Potamilus streckersoni]|uniref:ANK_REP_REGION domain-containing protein n=1 Tax=Potamilus streckersoni TaxID=2493646 RepID=A0AAE0SSR4_9BIVA|nr:hypothetical protein CHS0354_004973 [Potamilus streckersoni]
MDSCKEKSYEIPNYESYQSFDDKETVSIPIREGYNNLNDTSFENHGGKRMEIHCGKSMNSAVTSFSGFDDNNTETSHVSSTNYKIFEEIPQTRPFHELIQHTPPMSLSESDLCVTKTLTNCHNILETNRSHKGEHMVSRNIHKSLSFNERPKNLAYIYGTYDSKNLTQVQRTFLSGEQSDSRIVSTYQNQQQNQRLQSMSGGCFTQEIRLNQLNGESDKLYEGCTNDRTTIAKELKMSSETSAYSSQHSTEDKTVKLNYPLTSLSDREEETLQKQLKKSSSDSSFENSALSNPSKTYTNSWEETFRKRPLYKHGKQTPQVSSSESNLSWPVNHTECNDIRTDITSRGQKERKSSNKIRKTVSFNDGSRRPNYNAGTLDCQKSKKIIQALSIGEGTTDNNYSRSSEVKEIHSTRPNSMRMCSSSLSSVTENRGEEGCEDVLKEEENGVRLLAPRTAGRTIIQAENYDCGQIISGGAYVKNYNHQEIGTLNNVKIVKRTRKKSRTLTNIIDTSAVKLAEHKQQHLYQTKLIREETSRMRNKSNPALVILHGDGSTTAGMAILDTLSSDCRAIPLILQEPSQWAKVEMDKGYVILIKYEKQWDLFLDTIFACAKTRKIHAILLLSSKEVFENLVDANRKTMDSVRHTVVSYTGQYQCTIDERVNILKSKQEFIGLAYEDLKTIATTTPESEFFEYLKAYAKTPKAVESAVDFFQNPLPCLVEKIYSLARPTAAPMYRELYYVLSVVALSGGVLFLNDNFKCIPLSKRSRMASVFQKAILCSSTKFETGSFEAKFSETMKKIQSSLDLVNTPSSRKMLDIAKLWGKEYCNVDDSWRCTFIGQSVYLSVCLTLMHKIPTEFLKIVDISFITKFVRDEIYKSKTFETMFKLSSEQYNVISKRFVKEILSGNVRDVIDHSLFDNQEFVDSFFLEVDRMRRRYMKVLTSREVSEGNTMIFYGADKDFTDIVSRICRMKGWKYSSSNSNILSVLRDSSGTHSLVQEQNYKTLLKVSLHGKEEAFRSLTDLGTPITKHCLLNVVSSGNIQLVKNAINQNHWDVSVLSTILVHACKTCVEAIVQDSCYFDYDHEIPDLVKCLLERGCDPNEVSDNNMFPVETAVKENNVLLLKLLIKAGAKVNMVDNKRRGRYILHDAIETCNEEIVAVLLAQGLDPNTRDSLFRTPILHAVDCQNAKIVKALLEWKADPNMIDRCKRYPLHIACQNTDEDVVNALVQGGADVHVRDGQMCTPLYIASTHVHLGIVKCLQDNGARDINCAIFAVEQRMKNLLEILMIDFRAINDSGKTILEISVENKFHEITEILIERGCDTSIKTSKGYSLLVFAIMQSDLKLFKTLAAHGANVKSVDEEKNSALHIACTVGNHYMARKILYIYPDLLQATTKKGWTPLHVSAYFGNDQMVKLLLDSDADRNSKTRFGETPLYLIRSRRMNYEGRGRLYTKYQVRMGSNESFELSERLLSH